MSDIGTMRDLDQIREREDGRDPTRTIVLAVGGLAAACVLFAAGVLIGRDQDPRREARREDPLARLDALAAQTARSPTPELSYPSQLADRRAPLEGTAGVPSSTNSQGTRVLTMNPESTSAHPGTLGAVGTRFEPSPRSASSASPALDNNPPRAAETGATRSSSAVVAPVSPSQDGRTASGVPAPAGSEGAFSLQVSSFRNLPGAQAFAQRLRARGHRAFVASGVATTGTGTWHRVRIGPFSSLREVSRYRADFESTERLPTFIVRRDEDGAQRR
jgi:cell division septation protein DedD